MAMENKPHGVDTKSIRDALLSGNVSNYMHTS